MNNSVWYHPRIDTLGILEGYLFTSGFDVRGTPFSYTVSRDDSFLMYLGWVKVGEL